MSATAVDPSRPSNPNAQLAGCLVPFLPVFVVAVIAQLPWGCAKARPNETGIVWEKTAEFRNPTPTPTPSVRIFEDKERGVTCYGRVTGNGREVFSCLVTGKPQPMVIP